MARTKQTARKHTDGGANVGRKAKKTRLARALKASDKRWGSAKQSFVKPTAGRLFAHHNDPLRLDYRSKYNIIILHVVSVESCS